MKRCRTHWIDHHRNYYLRDFTTDPKKVTCRPCRCWLRKIGIL